MRVARKGAEFDGSTLVGVGDVENDISVLWLVCGIANHVVGGAYYEKGSNSKKRIKKDFTFHIVKVELVLMVDRASR
jgi:hypothetical protein